ncbi:tudor domain-containing protein 7-like isoform X3 [Bacillus rossius redtenbacheri]|uniref:tudor domain-containing protein 7-like isoform X3 n=1 Tax=Bacillus rossius redtenbacheri TaxID=93214 RepID=UPI002FDD8D23
MSVVTRGRGSWKKPDTVRRFPTVVGSFADKGSSAIENAAKKFVEESELIINAKSPEDCIIELVRQHPGGLLAEHLPGEYQRMYGRAVPPDWPDVVESCPDLSEDSAPGLGPKIHYRPTTTNYINQEPENTWVVEVLDVQSTADVSVKTDDNVVERCSLCALEGLSADGELTVFLKEVLCGRLLTCHLATLDDPPSVVLYDQAANMNLRFAEQTALQAAPSQLKEGMSPCVRVTHVADRLSVCVRRTEQYFQLLSGALGMAARLRAETRRRRFVVSKRDLGKMCALQISGGWYRVKLQRQDSLNEVTVKLVDVGSSVSVDPFTLVVLDSISAVFSNVPPQAVEVTLDQVHNLPHVHDLLVASKNHKTDLVMKVLRADKLQPPVVVFRDPAEPTSSPKPVSESFAYPVTVSPVDSVSSSLSQLSLNSPVHEEKPKITTDDASSHGNEDDLKYWQTLVGKRFKVCVSSADGPLNITLQLSKNMQALTILMEMVQEHYESLTPAKGDPGNINPRTAYAAFVDNLWYRVRIVGVSDDKVMVFLVDYGSEASVPLQQIRKLPKELSEERLPFQSLRAELKGARELALTPEDSAGDLGLVPGKTLMCKVWSVEKDFPCSARVQVDLSDENGDSVLDLLCAAASSDR